MSNREGKFRHKRHKYWISSRGHAKFTKCCRKSVRARAKNDLCHGREPQPRYSVESSYFD
ncbi:hypothetical protein LJC40_02310 [Synergistaceae bacterium OttesenSCG-928-D05]|nr:hypothetical protein [Synergistaceae bacterium OttesenSCG-928-D05]